MEPIEAPFPEDPPSEQTVIVALNMLRREQRHVKRRLIGSAFAWVLALAFLLVGIGGLVQEFGASLLFFLYAGCFATVGIASLPRSGGKAVRLLNSLRDPRSVGPLIDALEYTVGADHYQIVMLLTDLLPALKASEAHLLTSAHRRKLDAYLLHAEFDHYADFLTGILKAYEQVGDKASLQTVRQMAAGLQIGNSRSQQVQEAAKRCLPFLTERIESQRIGRTLLRPSFSEADANLLHPAPHAPENTPETLLRPTQQ